MGGLPRRTNEVLQAIKKFMIENGTTPTVREIGELVGLYSTSTVQIHLERLREKGYIEQVGKRYRVKGMRYVEDEE
jgi:repressor LexA